MVNTFSCCCCWITLRTSTIFLLTINIILQCCGVGLSLFCYDKLPSKLIFEDKVEMSMAYVFVLIEMIVFFSTIVSAFKRKPFMFTFATVMLLLESFFIILVAIRVHYNRKNFRNIWEYIYESVIAQLSNEKLKAVLNGDEESTYLASGIIFYSIFVLLLIFKLCCVVVVNNCKNDFEAIRIEKILHQLVCGRRKLKSSRPTSYEISATIADIIDSRRFY